MAALGPLATLDGTVGRPRRASNSESLFATTETTESAQTGRRGTHSPALSEPEPVREPASLSESEPVREPATSGDTSGLAEALSAAVAESGGASRSTALDEALAALKPLVARPDVTEPEWLYAARLLRAAAIERRFSSPRVASTALLLSDALSFTEVGTVALAGRTPLRRGLLILMQGFVSTDDERGLIRELLEHRWYVTPGFDPATFEAAAAAN